MCTGAGLEFSFSLCTLYLFTQQKLLKNITLLKKMLIYNGLSMNYKFISARSGQDFSLFASWIPANLLWSSLAIPTLQLLQLQKASRHSSGLHQILLQEQQLYHHAPSELWSGSSLSGWRMEAAGGRPIIIWNLCDFLAAHLSLLCAFWCPPRACELKNFLMQ